MRATQPSPFAAPATTQPAAAQPEPPAPGPVVNPEDNPEHGPGPERVGYMRVSTRSQNSDTQLADLIAAGCRPIFTDHGISGRYASRPELDKAIAYLREGDTFVITRLSRAMRSLKHLIELADELRAHGIGLVVLKQSIDTTTPTGRLIFHILGAIDEFQRELIVEGTLEGLQAARAKGHKGGQPRALTPEQEDLAISTIQAGAPIARVARTMRVSRATLYRAMERRGLTEPADGEPAGTRRGGVSPEDRDDILTLLQRGENISATAKSTGFSTTTVRRVWQQADMAGDPPGTGRSHHRAAGGRPAKLNPGQRKLLDALIAEDASVADAARALDVSRATVYREMERRTGKS